MCEKATCKMANYCRLIFNYHNVWESYLEDGKLPQTTCYLPQTNESAKIAN